MLSPLRRHLRRFFLLPILSSLYYFITIAVVNGANDLWPLDRPEGMPSIQSLEVMCGKDHMDVHLTFSQAFEGIVSSKGQHGDPRCVYVPPSSGQKFFSFRIAYARCGTKPDLHGQFYENTVVIQYDKDLLEVWDEAKRLRCEWFNDYEKTASKPPMVIADLDVIQLDFRGDNVDCWMEIQHGKGPWAPPVSGIVPLGSTLTLVVAINDYRGEFDMRVKSCVASDGGGHIIQLSDEFGCVLRPKMISRFLKAKGADERASVITYAFFHAFKFPDALSVHIKCKVEICRHGCLDHCQVQPDKSDINSEQYIVDRKDDDISLDPLHHHHHHHHHNNNNNQKIPDPEETDDLIYDDIIHENNNSTTNSNGDDLVQMSLNSPQYVEKKQDNQASGLNDDKELAITAMPQKNIFLMNGDQFPHGPRTLESPPVAAPRSLSMDSSINDNQMPSTTKKHAKRKRRSIIISDRKARNADVGVSGLYEVISEADLAFSPDGRAEAVTVFQGRIREEVVYGICMPMPGFSLLFVLVAVSAVISALVAGTLLYRYQIQKEHIEQQRHRSSLFTGLVSLKLLRFKNSNPTNVPTQPTINGTTTDTNKLRIKSTTLNGKADSRNYH